ncbi:aminotransferase class I/II-fold pyridoxal phosphate-dependent enzyme [Streptomyces halobius]|uniref:8-amino-7-oxononanoate synthase n=1 Tax=Streptomyces halobius TaxID=2879846 RepID=A0ABY4M3E2_9ACTN|nr:pyridoxal phosphate-dependent aminotransferase family protein [Streptomyces halobius]UQA90865.1 pyridoxal phosphate-dependent aminotransferase family protein [Streptomyces halobius]
MTGWIADIPLLDEFVSRRDIYPYYLVIEDRPTPGEVVVDGVRAINAASTDYLGLATDSGVRAAASQAAAKYGACCTGSPMLGTMALHHELEEELADFLRRPAVMLTMTGFQANLSLSALFGPNHMVIADQHIHASLVESVSLGRAEHRRFGHNNVAHAERLMRTAINKGKIPVVVTEGAFSLGGDLCPLPQLAELAERYGAGLIVDGAHDFGVLGKNGRGAGEHFDAETAIDIVTGTLCKAFGSVGGFVAGSVKAIRNVRHSGPSQMYSASLPPASAAAALTAVRTARARPELRAAVWNSAQRLHRGLAQLGHRMPAWPGPAVALPAGEPETGLKTWRALLDAGVFTGAFLPPSVAGDQLVIRITVTAGHTPDQVDRIIEAVGRHLPPQTAAA